MSTVIRTVLIAAALIGSVSAVSARNCKIDNRYTYSDPLHFDPATFFDELQRNAG